MKFWQLLRWIGSALVLVVAVLACFAELFSAQQSSAPTPTSISNPQSESVVAPSVQPSNNRGL